MGEHEAPQPPTFMGPPQFRLWLYRIFFAISFALGVFGTLEGNKITALNFVISAVLGVAAENVPRQEK